MKKGFLLAICSLLAFAFVIVSCKDPQGAYKVTKDEFIAAVEYIQNKAVIKSTTSNNTNPNLLCDGDGCCIGESCTKGSNVALPASEGFILKLNYKNSEKESKKVIQEISSTDYVTPLWEVQTGLTEVETIEDVTSATPKLCVLYNLNNTQRMLMQFDVNEQTQGLFGNNMDDNGFLKQNNKYWAEDETEDDKIRDSISGYEAICQIFDMIEDEVNGNFDNIELDDKKGYKVVLTNPDDKTDTQCVYVRFNTDKKIERISQDIESVAPGETGSAIPCITETCIDIQYNSNLKYTIKNCPEELPTATASAGEDD